ncbi:MAG: hypothetical protein ACLTX3_08265 [Lachnospiraceae bacterium]
MLRKLFQSKKSIEEKKIFEKDEIAKMLRVNPEQLKKFEEAYQCEVLNHPEPSDDLFATNAKDSKKKRIRMYYGRFRKIWWIGSWKNC